MALEPGTKLGVYEITAQIGAGGMGEVYRAHDTTLDRDVAIKVLPDAFATDPERLARFEREAKVLASLNHPNIAAIYGLEKSNDTRALILELVEGPTLHGSFRQSCLVACWVSSSRLAETQPLCRSHPSRLSSRGRRTLGRRSADMPLGREGPHLALM